MVNLDQAQKNVRNAQDQLDQALKELEKAKKSKVWERDFPDGFTWCEKIGHGWGEYGPCKVTVRPLGGPGPRVYDLPAYSILDLETGYQQASNFYINNTYKDRSFRVTVEEIE